MQSSITMFENPAGPDPARAGPGTRGASHGHGGSGADQSTTLASISFLQVSPVTETLTQAQARTRS